jgi:ribonucleoside-triphosphate reductase
VRTIAENYKLPYYTMSPTYSVCKHHGYLNGEQFTCPECGSAAEVYSRITGYYRPVKNWNVGKSQEFKDRLTYNVGTSVLKKSAPVTEEIKAVKEEIAAPAPAVSGGKAILFSRVTCPNCRVAEQLLNKAGVAYEKLIADDNKDLCLQYGVKGAPTLVIVDGENHENHYSVPEIKKYLASL